MQRRTFLKQAAARYLSVTRSSMAMGRNSNSSMNTVALRCGGMADEATLVGLCEELHQQLVERDSSRRYIIAPENGEKSSQKIVLNITKSSKTVLVGHLTWDGGDGGTGPDVTLGVKDAILSPYHYGQMVKTLLKLSKLPV